MANDSAHMKSHAGMRLRKEIAAAGSAIRGSHPGHEAVGVAAYEVACVSDFKQFVYCVGFTVQANAGSGNASEYSMPLKIAFLSIGSDG